MCLCSWAVCVTGQCIGSDPVALVMLSATLHAILLISPCDGGLLAFWLCVQGQLQVVYGKDSRINNTGPGGNFEQNLSHRISNNITSEFPTEENNLASSCSRSDPQLCTLRQLQRQVACGQTGPFRVRLRLVGYYPRDLQQWCKLTWKPVGRGPDEDQGQQAGQQEQQQQLKQQWDWAAQLLLEDATGDG